MDEVMFASINLFSSAFYATYATLNLTIILDEHFYPCSGSGVDDTFSPLIINIPLSPARPFIWDPKLRSKLTSSQRNECCTQASKEFRFLVIVLVID